MCNHMTTKTASVPFEKVFDIPLRNGLTRPKAVRGKGVKMINMGELFAHSRINNVEADRVPFSESENNFLLKSGDLLFARQSLVLAGAGKCSIFMGDNEDVTYEGHIIRARINPEIANPFFYYYFFNSPVGRQTIEGIVEQVAAAGIRGSDLAKLNVPYLPLPEQRAIAGILGALDDKIEVNRRMNVTLESMARAVFRQWFVENEEVENWEVGKLGDVAENIKRSANPNEINPDTHYIGLEHMPRKSIGLAEWGNASTLESNKFAFKTGEFLFGKLRPYFHKVGIAPVDGVCSTDILVIAPKSPEWYGFVLGHISSVELINYTDSASTGTKMPRTNWSDIAKYEAVLPPVSLAKKYNEIFLPIAEKIRANIIESRTLASLRDSLLPKLMRGEVRVKDVEEMG